jgi:hypothetical protein
VSLAGQRALARLFGLETDADAPPADPAPTGLEWMGGVPFPAADAPPPDGDGSPDFDGGAREIPPAPDEPASDHDDLIARMLGQQGEGQWPR